MNNLNKTSDRYFFITEDRYFFTTEVLTQYKKYNIKDCKNCAELLSYVFGEKYNKKYLKSILPVGIKAKHYKTFLQTINNIKKIDCYMKLCSNNDITKFDIRVLSTLRCAMGQMLYSNRIMNICQVIDFYQAVLSQIFGRNHMDGLCYGILIEFYNKLHDKKYNGKYLNLYFERIDKKDNN
jgi:hypothetical protein